MNTLASKHHDLVAWRLRRMAYPIRDLEYDPKSRYDESHVTHMEILIAQDDLSHLVS